LSGVCSPAPYPCRMGGRVTTASGRPIGVAGFEALRSADEGQPLAVPREQVAGRLGHKVAPGKLEAALAAVEPYRRADGTPLWSLHLVRVELELVRRTRRARVQVAGRWE
jgi:hypothetical protein